MSDAYFDYYDGSRLFQPISDSLGIQLDLFNFLLAQLTALCLARLFRKTLRHASEVVRHATCLAIGIMMAYFCFGRQAIHIAMLPTLVYIILRTVNPRSVANLALAVSMLYLSCLHLHRQMYHSADYSLDITGPLMVITQRVTSLAYSLQAGQRNEPRDTKNGAVPISELPSILEYFSYTLAFQTIMCGPTVFYNDYINFIKGTQFIHAKKSDDPDNEPSPKVAVACKVLGSLLAACLYLKFMKLYPIGQLHELTDPKSEASRWSMAYLLWFAYISTAVVRCKYYHAWLLADAICNNCGIGFNGYDDEGRAKWDRVSNIDVVGFEISQNFRSAIASWNKTTNAWLRTVAYRPGRWGTLRVYALSAVWHGFQPGYYITFLSGGLFTLTARKMRNKVRPLFMSTRLAFLYHAVTFVSTRITMTVTTVPFVVLKLGPCLAFYSRFYYSFHLMALAALLIPLQTPERTHSNDIQTTITRNGNALTNGNGCVNNNTKLE